MPQYYFLFGNHPGLSRLELQTVLTRLTVNFSHSFVNEHFDLITEDIDPNSLLPLLGGTVKIYQAIEPGVSDPLSTLISHLKLHPTRRLALSTDQHPETLNDTAKQLKQLAHQAEISISYRLLSRQTESAGIIKDLPEYTFIHTPSQLIVATAVAVQDIHYWTAKDYDRPFINPQKGMLPPKIARILVNLALPTTITPDTRLFDPFCGMGTILVEGLDLGCSVIGADLESAAVEQAAANCHWFNKEAIVQVFQADVLHLTNQIPLESLEAIVFEGYLGPPHLQPGKIDNYVKGLTKFYLGALKHLQSYIKPGGFLVGAIPAYVDGSKIKSLSRLVDSCERLGYTQKHESLWYYRPQAQIRRQILIWQKR
jgi:tRNA G10  N-methylase Trm11